MLRKSPNAVCSWKSRSVSLLESSSQVGAFFQTGNAGSTSPPRSSAFWLLQGLSAKAKVANSVVTGNWQAPAAGDPAEPWVPTEGCGLWERFLCSCATPGGGSCRPYLNVGCLWEAFPWIKKFGGLGQACYLAML